MLKKIIIIILTILLVIMLAPLLVPLVGLVIKIIALPFKGIAWIVKKCKNKKAKDNDNVATKKKSKKT